MKKSLKNVQSCPPLPYIYTYNGVKNIRIIHLESKKKRKVICGLVNT